MRPLLVQPFQVRVGLEVKAIPRSLETQLARAVEYTDRIPAEG